jgi:hypothetical protein
MRLGLLDLSILKREFGAFDLLDGGRRVGVGLRVDGHVTWSLRAMASLDAIGIDPGDVAAAVLRVMPDSSQEPGEPWDAPHRTSEESFDLLHGLIARHQARRAT